MIISRNPENQVFRTALKIEGEVSLPVVLALSLALVVREAVPGLV